jgi:hypothetical protein
MNHKEVQEIAIKHGFGEVYFQFNIAINTGKEFEVGYIYKDKRRHLFCKRGVSSSPDAFYLCNDFEQFSPEPRK